MTGEDPAQAAVKKLRHAQDRLNACTYIFEAPERHGGGPLAGLTIALKDIIDQKGVVTTCGSGFYREVAKESAPVVDRIEGAGGSVVARTGLHEFAYGFSSENDWFGPVRN
ncbi:MAG: amidase family protein, partial [Acidimicrobiia bacterium]